MSACVSIDIRVQKVNWEATSSISTWKCAATIIELKNTLEIVRTTKWKLQRRRHCFLPSDRGLWRWWRSIGREKCNFVSESSRSVRVAFFTKIRQSRLIFNDSTLRARHTRNKEFDERNIASDRLGRAGDIRISARAHGCPLICDFWFTFMSGVARQLIDAN